MLGKLVGSLIDSLHEENCQKTYVATLSAMSSSRSFIIPLLINSTPIRVLVDCGASDCFISPNFTTQHHLQTHPCPCPSHYTCSTAPSKKNQLSITFH